MRKRYNLILFVICLFSFIFNVNASTMTYNRENIDNYGVNKKWKITEKNKQNILRTPLVDAREKIYDFSNILSDEDEKLIYNKIVAFTKKTGMDVVILTNSIPYTEDKVNEDYASDFYDYNDFGIGDDNSGLLFLIDMDTREIYFTTTGDAISVYTDYRKNAILDKVFRYMSDEDYFEGTRVFINAILSYSSIESSEDTNYTIDNDGMIVKDNSFIVGVFIFALIGTIVIILIMAYLNKTVHKANSSRSYLNNSTMRVNKVRDIFLGSHVSKVALPSDTGSGGGSSTHSGSSGISHGGGGHKF